MTARASQSGNMLIYILGAIFLLGLLMVMVRGSTTPGGNIDTEEVMLRASQVQQYMGELERAVNYIIQNGHSETEIRFAQTTASAYDDPVDNDPVTRQVFNKNGGGAIYRDPPAGINDGTGWQFYATTHIKDMGTDTAADMKAELIAVLPNVTTAFCERINTLNGQTLTLTANHDPTANGCIYAGPGNEFVGTFGQGATTNTIAHALFTKLPPKQACIKCQSGAQLYFYSVLLPR